MYPSLSTRRRLLLALLILGGKSTYSNLKSFLPADYSGPEFYAMLKRLESEALIRRRHPLVRLLPAGIELLAQRYGPRIWQLKVIRLVELSPVANRASPTQPLNDSWWLIIFNFPTGQAYSRSRLAGRLLELGCRPLRDGVYISPYPILPAVAEWSEENHCLERVALATINNQQSTINNFLNGWDLSAFSRRYLSLLDRLNISKGISLSPKRDRAFARIKSDFLDLVVRDPLFPQTLLPVDYPLARVIAEITSLDKDISRDEIKIDNLPGKKSIKNTTKTEDKPLEK